MLLLIVIRKKREEQGAKSKAEETRIITWASADILGRALDFSLN